MSLARRALLGPNGTDSLGRYRLLVPPLLFLGVFVTYALGVFAVSGGVVFLAGEAALVGVVAAAVLAYRRAGLALAWTAVYGALLGHNADHYLLGLSGRSLAERVAAFLGPDGLAAVGVQALVLGALAWVVGGVARRAVEAFRTRGGSPPSE